MVATLVKGQNAALTAPDVVVSVQVAAPAELSALLVTEQGKVRSDADFVFYNQPSGPGCVYRPGKHPRWRCPSRRYPPRSHRFGR